jgi:hypothetical protein
VTVAALAAAVVLASVHVFAGRLRFLRRTPRSIWLSLAGGVSVAYVFVHLLPELASHQGVVERLTGRSLGFVEHHVYLVALVGLVVFYGLERLTRGAEDASAAGPGTFWINIGAFAAYNALVGYLLLHRESPGARALLFFAVAMVLHFVINDYGLRDRHRSRYEGRGRWLLAGSVLVGWGVGATTEVPALVLALLVSFLAGGVIMNVLKEELPPERKSRFLPFAVGVAAYSIVLLVE